MTVPYQRQASIETEAREILAPAPRERALEAMASLCASQGYAETTFEQVAERSGMPVEELRALFGSKEECGEAAIDAVLAELMTILSARDSAADTAADCMLRMIKGTLELLAAWPSFASLLFVSARQTGPPRLRERLEAGAGVLAAMLRRLAEDAGGSPVSQRTARAALGGVEAVVRREIAEGRAAELPRLLPDFIYAMTVASLGIEDALQLAQRARELLWEDAWDESVAEAD